MDDRATAPAKQGQDEARTWICNPGGLEPGCFELLDGELLLARVVDCVELIGEVDEADRWGWSIFDESFLELAGGAAASLEAAKAEAVAALDSQLAGQTRLLTGSPQVSQSAVLSRRGTVIPMAARMLLVDFDGRVEHVTCPRRPYDTGILDYRCLSALSELAPDQRQAALPALLDEIGVLQLMAGLLTGATQIGIPAEDVALWVAAIDRQVPNRSIWRDIVLFTITGPDFDQAALREIPGAWLQVIKHLLADDPRRLFVAELLVSSGFDLDTALGLLSGAELSSLTEALQTLAALSRALATGQP